MKTLLVFIAVFALLVCHSMRGEEAKDTPPVMAQVGQEIRQVTTDRAFTNDDAARVARHLFELLAGPMRGRSFADVTEPDAKHIEINVGYDLGIAAHSYHIRFFREPVERRFVYVESILLATNNI